MADDNFNEIVNVIWNVSQPEEAIGRLMAKLNELENKLNSVAAAAARMGSAGGIPQAGVTDLGGGYTARTQVTYRNPLGNFVRASDVPGFSNVTRTGSPTASVNPDDFAPGSGYGGGASFNRGFSAYLPSGWTGDWTKNTSIVPSNVRSTSQLFEDLQRFNAQAAEQLRTYKRLWDQQIGGGGSNLGPYRGLSADHVYYGDIVGGALGNYAGVGAGPSIIEGTFSYASNAMGPYGGGLVPRPRRNWQQYPLPPVDWYVPPAGGAGGGGAGGGGTGWGGFPPAPPFGPYTEQRFANEFLAYTRNKANFAWGIGDTGWFENIMQNQYNPVRWNKYRKDAAVDVFESEYDLNQMASLAGGGRYARREYVGAQVRDFEAKFNQAKFAGNAADVDRYGKALKDARDEYDRLGDTFNIFDNKFVRHIAWIAQGIAIWGALHLAINLAATAMRELVGLENTQARLGFISGASYAETAAASAAGARYGLSPQQSGQGAITGAQLGLSGRDAENARQLALVFGADQYNNALQEIYQTEQRANAVGVEHVKVMDFIATAYKTAPGSMEIYFDALQQGILLSRDLGVEAEAAGLSILKMATATEDSPEKIAVTLQSAIANLRKPKVQDALRTDYGIQTAAPGQMLRDISAEITRLVQGGNVERAKALIDEITGGLNAPQRQLQLLTDFQELNKLFNSTNTELDSMNKLLDGIGSTGEATFNRLKASFLAYVDAILAANKQGGASTIGKALGANMAGSVLGPLQMLDPNYWARNYASTVAAGSSLAEYLNNQAMQTNYQTATGKSPFVDQGPRTYASMVQDQEYTPEYRRWIRQQTGETLGSSRQNPFARGQAGPGPAIGPNPPPTYEFGGFQNFEKGWDWTAFEKSVRNQEGLLRNVPGYELDQKQVAFWDEATQSYKTMIADLNAIRFATDEQRKLMQQQITGVFNVPAGGEALVAFYALAQGFVPNTKSGKSAGGGGGAGDGENPYDAQLRRMGITWGKHRPRTDEIGVPIEARGDTYEPISSAFEKRDPGDDFSGVPDAARQTGKSNKQMRSMPKPGIHAEREQNQMQSRQLSAITINNTVRVYIDGKQVSHAVQRQNYRSFGNIRNNAFAAPSSQVAA